VVSGAATAAGSESGATYALIFIFFFFFFFFLFSVILARSLSLSCHALVFAQPPAYRFAVVAASAWTHPGADERFVWLLYSPSTLRIVLMPPCHVANAFLKHSDSLQDVRSTSHIAMLALDPHTHTHTHTHTHSHGVLFFIY
jgi:hypothetical protein